MFILDVDSSKKELTPNGARDLTSMKKRLGKMFTRLEGRWERLLQEALNTEYGPEQREGIPSYNIPKTASDTSRYAEPADKGYNDSSLEDEDDNNRYTATAVTMTTRQTLPTYGP